MRPFLKEWRERAGLSQVEVARALRVRQATVSALESPDAQSVKYAYLDRLARLFKCRVSELFERPPR